MHHTPTNHPMNHTRIIPTGRHAPAAYRHHVLTGTPQQVANVLANHHTAGTLVAATAPRPAPGRQVWVRITIRETPPAPNQIPPTVRRIRAHRPPRRAAALVAAITAPVVGALTAVAYLAGQLVEWATAHAATIAGVALLATLIAAALRGTAGRGKRHCPGC
jgi:hypothetical protein